MPSHTADDPQKKAKAPSWMKEWHVKGNDKADSCADTAAAALHVIPRDIAAPLVKVLNNLGLFQERHIAVSKLLPQRNRNVKVVKEPSPSKESHFTFACSESPHNCIHKDGRIYSIECSMSVASAAPHVFDVLKSTCLPDLKLISYPVGNTLTQPTHSIVLYGGVFMCLACGGYRSKQSN